MHVTKGKIRPLRNKILVKSIDQGERKSKGGIILPSADLVEQGAGGIRPRWAEVYAVGPEQKDVTVGDWVLMEHGRWTEEYKIDVNGESVSLWMGDPNGVLGISENGKPDGV